MWTPGSRWWTGTAPEWDIVAEDIAGKRLLLGEAKLTSGGLQRLTSEVAHRAAPDLPAKYRHHTVVRAVFLPETQKQTRVADVAVVSLRHMLHHS
jgi:hypothetical protein